MFPLFPLRQTVATPGALARTPLATRDTNKDVQEKLPPFTLFNVELDQRGY